MTSQSPPDAGSGLPPRNYVDAWLAIRVLVMNGASWSGRERNALYLNLGGREFADVSVVSDANSIADGRSIAAVDWDDDGRVDLFLKNRTAPRVQFFRNQSQAGGAFVSIGLEGVECNRDAIGARVEVHVDGRVLRKTLYAGDGYLSQSSKRLHFGLGDAERIERLVVRWPGGGADSFENLEVDTRYAITQGADAPRKVPARTVTGMAAVRAELAAPAGRARARVPLLEKLPLAPITIPAFDAPDRKVSDLAGGPVLLNLWGTTCAACMQEFDEFRERKDELAGAVRIVPLVVDPAAEHGRAQELLAEFELGADAGVAGDAFKDVLQVVLAEVLEGLDEVPLPTSLLLDGSGQLVAIYPGRVDVDELLADVALLSRMKSGDPADTRLTDGLRVVQLGRDYEAFAQSLAPVDPELAAFYLELAGD